MIIHPQKIETALIVTMAEYATAWSDLSKYRQEYTVEGLAAEFARRTQRTAERLAKARADVDAYVAAIDLVEPAERGRILPPAPANGYNTTHELAAARVVGRAGEWTPTRYADALESLAGTPTATLITEELLARELIEDTHIDYMLATHERYAATRRMVVLLITGVNNVLKPLLSEADRAANVETWLNNHHTPGRHVVALSAVHEELTIDSNNGYVHAAGLPALPKKVTA